MHPPVQRDYPPAQGIPVDCGEIRLTRSLEAKRKCLLPVGDRQGVMDGVEKVSSLAGG